MEYLARKQIFVSFEPDDEAVRYLPTALGEIGKQINCFSGDYGHWDGMHTGCVNYVAKMVGDDHDYLSQLLSGNSMDLYGSRLRERVEALLKSELGEGGQSEESKESKAG